MAKTNKNEKEINISLNTTQAASLGMMLHEVLKATGMKYIDIISDLKKQIGAQLPPPKTEDIRTGHTALGKG